MKSCNELKKIHSEHYVKKFVAQQTPYRIDRLMDLVQINKTSNVVDFACGNAILMQLIAPKVLSYSGVDFSESFIKEAIKKKNELSISNAYFYCSSIDEFSQKHIQKFDVGFAMDFSEHVYDDEWLLILRSMKASLISGGKLYIHTPNADFFVEKLKDKNIILKQFPEHIAVRNLSNNITILQKAGFNISKAKLIPHYNILKYLHIFSFIPIIGKYFKARIFIEAST